MSEKYVWRMRVTDSQGGSGPSAEEAVMPNPYISDEPAQHVAERVLALIVPGYAAQEPPPRAVEVQVWVDQLRGDPIATAEWHRDS